ncbi:MAG TPA: DUF4185 domain-containing protein [Pseudonocardia sp.]|nr:DUF4185 domain-containing protein [Pseudonocardia sp.]
MTAPTEAHGGHPTRGGSLYAAATLTTVFVVLAILVALHWQPLAAFDPAADTALHPYVLRDPSLRRAVVAVTNAGSPVSVDVLTVIAAGLLLRARRVAMAVYVVATRLVELAIETAAKHLIARPRPQFVDPVSHASSFSFPSGHTAGTAALCMSLIVVVHQVTRTRTSAAATLGRIGAVLLVILAIGAVAASRVLLGVHYPSDVLGGALLGIACASGLAPLVDCVPRVCRASVGGVAPSPPSRDGAGMALTTKIADLTGPGRTDTFGVGGTDLGVVATAPDGRLVAVFGDTFERATVGGPGWRSPVVLFADPDSVTSGLRWTGSGGGPGDYASQLVDYPTPQRWRRERVTTMLPTDMITIGDTMFLHVMACHGLGNVHWTEILASTDNGVSWQPTGARWSGAHCQGLFQMLTWALGDDGYLYAYTTGFRRDAGLLLHRVPASSVTDPESWRPWGFADGKWAWGNPATVTLPGAYGELCLRRVPGADGDLHWLLTFFDAGAYRIDVMLLDRPNADLYRAPRTTVLTGAGWDGEDHSTGQVAQLYGGYVVPGSTLSDLHLAVSQWNTATNWPYHVMQFRTDISELLR